jgi:hypothetical protein
MQHEEQVSTQPTQDIDTLTESGVNEIRNLHLAASAKDFRQLLRMPRLSLIKFAMTEKNAKNTAYYFILSQGYYDAFVEYSKQH